LPVLERSQTIPAPLDRVWEFFSDPANLAKLTPPGLRFRIVAPPAGQMRAGSHIEYRIRWLVFRLRWMTRITAWEPRRMFADVQEAGPYRTWTHSHVFEAMGAAGVRMRDRVEYTLPFGPLGRLVHAALVRRQLERIFDFRERAIREIFGAA
jgi:ligand-binding SRPBCC domain-containing protein